MNSEVKVGIMFFLGLGLVLWLTIFTTGITQRKGTYAVLFPRVTRLKEGDPVTFNGVRVGTITEVAPVVENGKPLVQISFTLQSDREKFILVDEHSEFAIVQGMLGGSNLEILSRSGQPITPEAIKGRVGKEPTNLDDVLASVQAMISENRAELKQAITALREGMERFGKASTEIEQLVKENRQQVGSAITNFSEMSERIGRLVEENREAIRQAIVHFDELAGQFTKLVEENRYSLKSAIDRLPTAVDNVANAAKSIETAVEENRENLKTTVANITAFTPKLNRIGDNLEVITTQIASGKGTVGKLVFEDTLHDKVVAAVDNFNQRLEEVKPVTSGFSDLKLYLGADGGINTHTGAGYYGAYLRIEPRPWKFYQGGITYRTSPTDRIPLQEDPNKLNVDFNLLVGWRFFPDDEAQLYRLSVAAGLIDSNVGGTVQVPLLRRLTLDAMGRRKDYQRDPQDRRYEDGKVLVRAALTFRLWDRIYLSAGGDDLAEHAAPWVGLRAELLDNDLRNLTSVMGLAK